MGNQQSFNSQTIIVNASDSEIAAKVESNMMFERNRKMSLATQGIATGLDQYFSISV